MRPYGLVVRLAENLQKYPAEEVLAAPILIPEPDRLKVVDYLQHLTAGQPKLGQNGNSLGVESDHETGSWVRCYSKISSPTIS